MKTSVYLFCLFAIFQVKNVLVSARAVGTVIELDEDEKACVQEYGLDENRMKQLNSQDITPEDDTEFNKFMGCSWQKGGLMNANGKINYDVLKGAIDEVMQDELKGESDAVKFLASQMLGGAIDECKIESPKGKTAGQTAVKAQNCVMTKLNKMIDE